MISKIISVREFEGYVAQIVYSFSDNHEFEVGQILEELLFKFKIRCGYEDVVLVLDQMVMAGRMVKLIPKQKYKTQFAGAQV